MHLRSRDLCARMTAVGWLMLVAGGVGGWAQQPAAPQTPVKQQTQPPLTVDRDPVASPDVDAPAASQSGAPQGVGQANIARENGKYTLREDAYEVRLNATVLDSSG